LVPFFTSRLFSVPALGLIVIELPFQTFNVKKQKLGLRLGGGQNTEMYIDITVVASVLL